MGAKEKYQHENFDTSSNNQFRLVRQDRLQTTSDFKAIIGSDEYRVENYGAFGLCLFSTSPIGFEGATYNALLKLKDFELEQVEIKLVRVLHVDGGIENGFEIMSDPLNLANIKGIVEAQQVLRSFQDEYENSKIIPVEFKNLVYELKIKLENLRDRIDVIEKSTKAQHKNYEIVDFDAIFSNYIGEFLTSSLNDKFDELSSIVQNLDKDTLKESVNFFREQLKHLIYQSPFSEHSIRRPSGYAGDFELMNYLYRDENIGDTLFSKCLHRYYMNHPNAKAVRNRKLYLGKKILEIIKTKAKSNSPIKILSLACGPSEEIQVLMESNPEIDWSKVEFHLLDQDQNALKYAQKNIKKAGKKINQQVNAKYLHFGIKNVIQSGVEDKYDLIYSAGLFDYFSDPVASVAAHTLYLSLNESGKLIIGNFRLVSSHRALMDLALDWNLLYRNEDHLKHIYKITGGKIDIEAEPETINLFAIIEKTTPQ